MNNKITNFTISVMSAIGTIGVVVDLVINPILGFCGLNELNNIYKFFLGILMFITVFILIHQIKNKHTTLYDLQYTMSKNNKLHSLRALVMILHDYENGIYNKFHIKSASFTYRLYKKTYYDRAYNVKYTLDFDLRKKWNNFITNPIRLFRVYVISENNNKLQNVKLVFNNNYEYIPTILSCTTNGESGDQINSFSGLYKIQTVIPPDLNSKKSIAVKIEYTVNNQINMTDSQYNFVIIPQNYGKRIDKINVRLCTEIPIENLYCHKIGVSESLDPVESFPQNSSHEYKIAFKPEMKSAYFIQFNLSSKT